MLCKKKLSTLYCHQHLKVKCPPIIKLHFSLVQTTLLTLLRSCKIYTLYRLTPYKERFILYSHTSHVAVSGYVHSRFSSAASTHTREQPSRNPQFRWEITDPILYRYLYCLNIRLVNSSKIFLFKLVKGKITKASITCDSERHRLPSGSLAWAEFYSKKWVKRRN
jgi:hypothetical protein